MMKMNVVCDLNNAYTLKGERRPKENLLLTGLGSQTPPAGLGNTGPQRTSGSNTGQHQQQSAYSCLNMRTTIPSHIYIDIDSASDTNVTIT